MDDLLASQRAYYRARAPEYDAWFLRQGRYDRGEAHKPQWEAEVKQLEQALSNFAPSGDILELACGTGWWTERLSAYGSSLTAVDASPEVIALNKERLPSKRIDYVQAYLLTWQPKRTFDTVFFSFWLSHVPPERFERFWDLVRSALRRASLFRGLARPRDLGRKGASLAGPAGPHGHPPARRRPGVPDRQGVLRTGRAEGATRRAGLASGRAADRDIFSLRHGRHLE